MYKADDHSQRCWCPSVYSLICLNQRVSGGGWGDGDGSLGMINNRCKTGWAGLNCSICKSHKSDCIRTMHSLMSMVGCLYLCLDMFLKGRLFPDKAQFNKEIFHYRVDEHLHIFPSASSLLCVARSSLSLSSVFPSLRRLPPPRSCTHQPLWSRWLFRFFFFNGSQ